LEQDAQNQVEKFALSTSRGFSDWLAASGGSIAFTTYQAGKVFLIGVKPDGRLSIFERSFARPMGLGVSDDGNALLLATHYQIYRFDNLLPPGTLSDVYDAAYAPNQSWITGDLDVHDIGFSADGTPVFANTLFNCLAKTSPGFSFKPEWRPGFISKLAAEDRCHLNGMAMENGAPRYVTCISRSDVTDGWRDRRVDGGIVMDVASGEVVASGLSMPHSPRLYQGKLWLLESGTGNFGWVDTDTGTFNTIAFCPGYARGLSFAGNHAIVGLSLPRDNRTFRGLPLDDAMTSRDAEPRCGLLIIDLQTGEATDWVRIEGVVNELYDAAFLPGKTCPSMIGMKGKEIQKVISIDE
jgi:uncharacterized protein (TIGR03032 family)